MAFKFEKLRVWQVSLEFATNIHFLTRDFPKEEMFSLTSQIKRAADSISLQKQYNQVEKLIISIQALRKTL